MLNRRFINKVELLLNHEPTDISNYQKFKLVIQNLTLQPSAKIDANSQSQYHAIANYPFLAPNQ